MDESDIRKEQNKEVAASLKDHPKRQTKNKYETITDILFFENLIFW